MRLLQRSRRQLLKRPSPQLHRPLQHSESSSWRLQLQSLQLLRQMPPAYGSS